MRRSLALALTVGLGALSVGPAAAAPIPVPIPPLPAIPLPAPPAGVMPTLEIVAPIAYPVCGTAFLAYAVSTTEVSGLEPVVGPALLICGDIPRVDDTIQCQPDVQVSSALSKVFAATGVPDLVGLSPTAETTEVLFRVQDSLPAPATTVGIAQAAAGLMTCTPIKTGSGAAHVPYPTTPAGPATSTVPSARHVLPPTQPAVAPVASSAAAVLSPPQLPPVAALGPVAPAPETAQLPASTTDTVRSTASSFGLRSVSAAVVALLVVLTAAGWFALGRLMTSAPLLATGARAPGPRRR